MPMYNAEDIKKNLSAATSSLNHVTKDYEIILVKQSILLLIKRDFYIVPPVNSSEIIPESIIYEFYVKNKKLFIYDKYREKYVRLIKLNSA